MPQSNSLLPSKCQTFFSFCYDIDTQKYDTRFYTPILTKGRISRQEIENFLNQFNNQLPITLVPFWQATFPAVACSMLLTAALGLFLVFIFDSFHPLLLLSIYFILGVVLTIVFDRLYRHRKMKKMQKALEYYNLKIQGLGIKWCCDRMNEFCFLVIDLRRENDGNIPLTQANSESNQANENKIFDLILDVFLDGRVLNAQARAQDGWGSYYTPDMTDGRLSMEEFNEVVDLVYKIILRNCCKIKIFDLVYLLLLPATIIMVVKIPDYSCFPCWYPAIVTFFLYLVMTPVSLWYETFKRREKKKLVQAVIDRYNPNIESLGLRWVYPHSGVSIQIYRQYLLSGLADDEDLEIDPVRENNSPKIEMSNMKNGYTILH